VQTVTASDLPAGDDAIPRVDVVNTKQLQFNFSGANEGARIGVWIEWDADMELSTVSLYGDASAQRQVDGVIVEEPYAQLWFASQASADDLADTGTEVAVPPGAPVVFVPGASETLTTGNLVIKKPTLFYPPGDYVQINPGTDYLIGDFSLLFDAFGTADVNTTLFHLDHLLNTDQASDADMQRAYTYVDTAIARLRFKEFHVLAGTTEYTNPADFFKWARRGRYFTVTPITGVEVFNYDPGLDYLASQTIDSNGIVSDPSKNPDGYDATSIQAREHYQRVIDSDAIYKIVVCPLPAYLEEGTEDVGRGYHDLRHIGRAASIVITGKNWGDQTYYRQTVDGVIWVALFDSAVLKMTASGLGLHCVVEQDGGLVDVFDIVKPS
jgi:hypothetical protein